MAMYTPHMNRKETTNTKVNDSERWYEVRNRMTPTYDLPSVVDLNVPKLMGSCKT